SAIIQGNKLTACSVNPGIALVNGSLGSITGNKISLCTGRNGGVAIDATGDIVDIIGNSITNCGDDVIGINRKFSSALGQGNITGNKLTNITGQGIVCTANSVFITGNSIVRCG